jgi:DNA-binding XRE family transcriptional regulator
VSPKAIPPFRRRRLGRRIRELRESARMTLEVAAKGLDMNRFTLARLESGAKKMDVHIARSMMDLYDCYDSGLLDEVRQAVPPGWWTKYGIQDHGYFGMETEAAQVHEFSLINVPGLLQTRDYTRALLSAGMDRTATELANQVEARHIRQRRLIDDQDPLHLVAVVDESALRRQVGGREVMYAQLRHLVAAADWPTVSLQIVPHSAGAHGSMDGAFTIVTFPGGDPDILYVSYPTGAALVERPEEVRVAALTFDRARSVALDLGESVRLIDQIARECRPD